MAKKAEKRGRGRPPVDATLIMVRLRPLELANLDKAIKGSRLGLSRPAAIRALAQQATSQVIRGADL